MFESNSRDQVLHLGIGDVGSVVPAVAGKELRTGRGLVLVVCDPDLDVVSDAPERVVLEVDVACRRRRARARCAVADRELSGLTSERRVRLLRGRQPWSRSSGGNGFWSIRTSASPIPSEDRMAFGPARSPLRRARAVPRERAGVLPSFLSPSLSPLSRLVDCPRTTPEPWPQYCGISRKKVKRVSARL